MGTIPLNPPYQRGTLSVVGWVEVTKPFDEPLGNAQQATKLVLGFPRAQPNLQLLGVSINNVLFNEQ